MNILTKARILAHIAKWRLTWNLRDIDYTEKGLDPSKFVSAREAMKKIKSGSTIFSSGMAANARCSIFFWALKDIFEKIGEPKDLTWIVVGAQGGRARVPGTLEELNHPGLITRFMAGHLETVKALLECGDKGLCELHTLPQGIEAYLLEAQAAGKSAVLSETGVGTFLDPRVGGGSYVGGAPMKENFVQTYGEKLRYKMPMIDYSLFVAPYADEEGNIYMRHAATKTESYESSLAARKNGGMVIAGVADIIPKAESEIYLRADQVDFVVVNPRSEQTGSIAQRKYWPMFTVEHRDEINVPESVEKLKFACDILKITPVRSPAEMAVARLAAARFTEAVGKGALVNVGVGLGEEVSRMLYEGGLHEDITLFSETGVVGGLPTPGIFFGAAVGPEKLITSAQVFRMADEKLDATLLGILEVDSLGNVNVSNRGPRMLDYVGPGGLPDLVAAAKNIFFIGSWMNKAKFEMSGGKMRIAKAGDHKFKDSIREITFSGPQALAKGKNVFYATNVGLFKLTNRGMMLSEVMPGIDIQKDIIGSSPMRVVLPEGGQVPVVPTDIVTGEGFKLGWP